MAASTGEAFCAATNLMLPSGSAPTTIENVRAGLHLRLPAPARRGAVAHAGPRMAAGRGPRGAALAIAMHSMICEAHDKHQQRRGSDTPSCSAISLRPPFRGLSTLGNTLQQRIDGSGRLTAEFQQCGRKRGLGDAVDPVRFERNRDTTTAGTADLKPGGQGRADRVRHPVEGMRLEPIIELPDN